MSLMLIPPSNEVKFGEIFPDLAEVELDCLINVASLMNEKIFTPIIEAEDKEKAIEKGLDLYTTYLSEIFVPALPAKAMEWLKRPETVTKVYEAFRVEIKQKIMDPLTRKEIFSIIDIAEEHDRYTLELRSDIGKFITLIENAGPEIYLRTLVKTSLALNVMLLAIDKKPEAIKSLSQVAERYADELEPFVATFQVIFESELASLKERTSERDVEKAKELRGSLFAGMES